MKKHKSFVLYADYKEHIDMLTVNEKADLLDAIFAHVCGTEEPILEGMAKMAFSFIRNEIDRNAEKYEATCEKRREAANKRWQKDMQVDANASKSIICNAKHYDNDNDTDTDTDNDTDNENKHCSSAPPLITLPLNTGEEYPFSQKDIDEWSILYPNVNVLQEMRNMKGWCVNNPTKRKTKRGIRSFVNRWLAKEQDKGSRSSSSYSFPSQGTNKFANFQQSGTDWDAVAERIMMEQEQEREGYYTRPP